MAACVQISRDTFTKSNRTKSKIKCDMSPKASILSLCLWSGDENHLAQLPVEDSAGPLVETQPSASATSSRRSVAGDTVKESDCIAATQPRGADSSESFILFLANVSHNDVEAFVCTHKVSRSPERWAPKSRIQTPQIHVILTH
ncbi:hypothetical protein EYF80_016735 [Liparis tanakae]|uniref:Uncharacterized protein n=1 Tax=Liparis tanakae TaxID=230148 RepID=A0A4Z2I6I0_9TELE|nr:hypothetical protein EYF80_016735 [Liparis tanakae]